MATYYVDGDNGNNANDGSTEALAFKTISAAVSAASTGDTIYIQNNGSTVYNERVTADAKLLYLIGYGSTITDNVHCVVDGTNITVSTGEGLVHSTSSTSGRLFVISNMTIQNSEAIGYYVGISGVGNSTWLPLKNMIITDCAEDGLKTVWHIGPIFNIVCANNGGYGFNLGGYACATGCLAYNNTSGGFYRNASRLMCINCLAVLNGAVGFTASDCIGCIADINTTIGFNIQNELWRQASFCVATRNGTYGFSNGYSRCYAFAGSGDWANTTGASTGALLVNTLDVQITGDPKYVAPYAAGSRTDWKDFDYSMGADSAALAVQSPLGAYDSSYASVDSTSMYPFAMWAASLTSGGGSSGGYVPFRSFGIGFQRS